MVGLSQYGQAVAAVEGENQQDDDGGKEEEEDEAGIDLCNRFHAHLPPST